MSLWFCLWWNRYVAVKDHLDQDGLKRVLIITSNTWGLLALVLLLGYGIVDIPRHLWASSDIKRKLRHLQFKAAKLSTEIAEAESTEETINGDVRAMAGRVKQGDALRKYVNIVLLKANLDDGEGIRSKADIKKKSVVSVSNFQPASHLVFLQCHLVVPALFDLLIAIYSGACAILLLMLPQLADIHNRLVRNWIVHGY